QALIPTRGRIAGQYPAIARDASGSVRLGLELNPVVALDVVHEGAAPADRGVALATELEVDGRDQRSGRGRQGGAVRLHRDLRLPDGSRLHLDRIGTAARRARSVPIPHARTLRRPARAGRTDLARFGLHAPQQVGASARAGRVVETADVARATGREGIAELAQATGVALLELEHESILGVGRGVLQEQRGVLRDDRRVARVDQRRVADTHARLAGVVSRTRVAVVAGAAVRREVDALPGVGITEVRVARRRHRAVDGTDEDATARVRVGIAGGAGPLLAQVSLGTFGVVVARIHAVGIV